MNALMNEAAELYFSNRSVDARDFATQDALGQDFIKFRLKIERLVGLGQITQKQADRLMARAHRP